MTSNAPSNAMVNLVTFARLSIPQLIHNGTHNATLKVTYILSLIGTMFFKMGKCIASIQGSRTGVVLPSIWSTGPSVSTAMRDVQRSNGIAHRCRPTRCWRMPSAIANIITINRMIPI